MCAKHHFFMYCGVSQIAFFHPLESCFQPLLFYADPDWLLPVGSDTEPSDFRPWTKANGTQGLGLPHAVAAWPVQQIPAESLLSSLVLGTQHTASDFRQEQRPQTDKLRVLSLPCGVCPEVTNLLKKKKKTGQAEVSHNSANQGHV